MKKIKIPMTDHIVECMPEITGEKYPEENACIEWVMAKSGAESFLAVRARSS